MTAKTDIENTDGSNAARVEFTDLFAELVAKHGEENGGSEDFYIHNENRIGCRYADLSLHRKDDGWHYGQLPEAYPTPAECYEHWREDEARFRSANNRSQITAGERPSP